ncbi:cobalamin biosynthesis protein CobD [Halomonas campisalis]|uniref:Cobalamin biosynthesis protein CobD n=1 Tax=Billgrantia campisalis TaxID=74661 RepID=A0ABS9PBY8_9GAMM|nr:adenosylcobinamide-phosphate synthase CbiB [Halomonas campisalis]MCG6659289.1 cobalamin biosynthesis protein CobD [Halomonas campisalis]MDR5864288.1 adenosylcobinamide-phosphate synthase CbiB [Halomonas campisalis]
MAEPLSLALLGLVSAAILLDLLIGDPRCLPHPVVGMGRLIAVLERAWNHGSPRARRLKGLLLTALVVAGVFLLAWLVLRGLAWIHPALALVAELWLLATTLAIKGLRDAALAVAVPLARGDLTEARLALGQVVGRDTATLDEAEITRGAVESVAENSVDGITAPLFWALLGGAPLALAYKAVNTLDSMVGYRNARYADFGYASARLDDLANWLPARLTALAMWLGALALPAARCRGALASVVREVPRHASPNSGWPEAMMARLLGVRLGGTNHYAGVPSHRATLGEPLEALGVTHIDRAIRHMHAGWLLFLLMMAGLVLLGELLR